MENNNNNNIRVNLKVGCKAASNGTQTNWQQASLAQWYNKNMLGEEGMKHYASLFNFTADDKVLDLGSGDGTLLNIAAPIIESGAGVDMSDEQLEISKQKLSKFNNVKFIKSTFQNLNFDNGSFTKISMRKSLHHLVNDEKGALLHKCNNWLKPGGLIIIEDAITSFALYRKEERKDLIEEEAKKYYGEKWPELRDAVYTTLNEEYPCDLAQLTHHLLFTGFNILQVIKHTSFICTVTAQR